MYTGRGPVCGVITRRTGAGGVCARCCCDALAIDPAVAGGGAEGCVTCTAGGALVCCAAGGCAAAGGFGEATGAVGADATGFSTAGGAAGVGAANDGRCPSIGLITRFAGASGAAAGGAAATGFSATGAAGAAGFGGAVGGAATCFGVGGALASDFFFSKRLATSPGLEMCERSILVLISGSPEREPPSRAAVPPP